MVKLDNMLFEVSSEVRHRVLVLLNDEPRTVTSVSREMGISMTEASRHFNRLALIDLIQKKPDGEYSITILGKTVLAQLAPLEFITRHSEYFDSHDATGIPERFLNRIHELSEATPTYTSRANIMKTVEKMEKTLFEAKEFYDNIMDQSSMELIIYSEPDRESGDQARERSERGVRSRALMPPVDFDRIHPEALEAFTELHMSSVFEFRVLDKVPLFLQMNEKGVSLVAFPDKDGLIDFMGFEAKDEASMNWCRDVFEYYWERSKPFFD